MTTIILQSNSHILQLLIRETAENESLTLLPNFSIRFGLSCDRSGVEFGLSCDRSGVKVARAASELL